MTATRRPAGPFAVVYGIYALLAFVLLVLLALVFAVLLPGLERRRRWTTACARASFHAAGIPVTVRGLDNLPDDHCVVVANHASYVDGVLLYGFLPPRFSYVIKGEVQKVPVAGFFLRRIGARFVERFDAGRSARDARQLLKAAATGESLAVFPEGTFLPHAGLERFRAGAFAAAIKAELPVVPVVISGSRAVLPGEHVLPARHPMEIDVLEPIPPGHTAFASSRDLASLARERILEILDEPDLTA